MPVRKKTDEHRHGSNTCFPRVRAPLCNGGRAAAYKPGCNRGCDALVAGYDSRFLLVAVMLVFISYQLISLIAWITALSSPDAALRCRPQRWSFEPDGITIEYFDSDEEPETAIDTKILPHDTLDNIEYRGKHAYLFYKDSTKSTVRRSYIITASLIPAGAKLPQ